MKLVIIPLDVVGGLRSTDVFQKLFVPCTTPDPSRKFHRNAPITFWVMLLTNKQTDEQTNGGEHRTPLTEVIIRITTTTGMIEL